MYILECLFTTKSKQPYYLH